MKILKPAGQQQPGTEPADPLAITYLGQVGFILQHRGVSIVIDPYLTDSGDRTPDFPRGFWARNYLPPVKGEELRHVDLVLCTHDHLDHTDPETLVGIANASPQALFAGPRKSTKTMEKSGISSSRLKTLNADGGVFSFGDAEIHPIAAAHEEYEIDAEGYHANLSFVIRWGKWTLFHAGDAVCTPQLSTELEKFQIDIAFLPINGRDEARQKLGIVGNMNESEAAALAARHRFGLVVPTHYDLCENNKGSLPEFIRELEKTDPSCPYKAFAPGEQQTFC
jgi:L-ascorbate metabolism protein UlaG (beta-lactamase superfamily)